MVIVSVLMIGVAAAFACYALLQQRQQRAQRSSVKARFFKGAVAEQSAGPLEKLPFVSKALKKQQEERRTHACEAELPRMLDIIAMGMYAGLSFDAAFGLYVYRFNSELAVLCRERFEVWERGLISRGEGLEQLAACIDLPLFDRFCRTAARSIKHGIPMTPLIKEYAVMARKEFRNKQKEKVLKAPVKMLLPTGVLILPAMMMLVIGPIILDVTGRMV